MCKCRICLIADYNKENPFAVGTYLPPNLWGDEEYASFEEERRAEEDAQDVQDAQNASMYDGIFIIDGFYDNGDMLVNFFLLVGYY